MMIFRRTFLLAAVSALVLTACAQKPSVPGATYYLVRHAEKTAENPDPALTEAGEKRAIDLAHRLKDVKLTAIYSTDYTRTRDTAAPAAKAAGLEVQLYNAGALSEFADELLAQKGHILVTGHSNTTPGLSEALGGPAGEPIVEATEYDRLYILERTDDQITGRIERYGE